MSLFELIFGEGRGHGVAELARRLDLPQLRLQSVAPRYDEHSIPKRGGGVRRIHVPDGDLKSLQRRIHRRLLSRLRSHPCAVGFERHHSIVSNARFHCGQSVVLRMDLKDFFGSTSAKRVKTYFRQIGWNRSASRLLSGWCTYRGGLPQGAPTSPRLSNLVNQRMDARLAALAAAVNGRYTRYADDLTFSFDRDDGRSVHVVLQAAARIVRDFGYQAHRRRKLHIRRKHQRQEVCGLVVNHAVQLPRERRRWLRAVEHYHRVGKPASLSYEQLQGWRSLCGMIARQSREY